MEEKQKAIFFDRDGVLNDIVFRGEDFVVAGKKVTHTAPHNFDEFRIQPNIMEILEKIHEKGYLSIIVTNQPDINYGLLPKEEHDKIMAEIQKYQFDDIYICHHTRFDNCDCKKPKPGMLLDAAKKWNIDLTQSYIVGDTESDMGAGKGAGCKTVIIDADYNSGVVSDYRIYELSELDSLI